MKFFLITKASPWAKVKPKVNPNNKIFPNSISPVKVYASPSPTLMNSKTSTAAKAPIGSINMPSHFKTAEISFFNGIFLNMGVITVGPVTIIKAENKKEICQLKSKIKCAATAAQTKVAKLPKVISLVITGPTFLISDFFRVSPPSKSIILIASETK